MRYKTKPVEIEAIQWDGTDDSIHAIQVFSDGKVKASTIANPPYLEIPTLEGVMRATAGDFIIKGLKGEFYPCKPEIFKMKYEFIG